MPTWNTTWTRSWPGTTRHCGTWSRAAASSRRKSSTRTNGSRAVARAILNYGHTFGHALEAATRYQQLLHGEAVAIGMLCASRLAESLQLVDPEFTERQRRLLAAFGLPVAMPPVDLPLLLQSMQQDKKVAHGRLRFVLPVRMGHVELFGDIDPQLVRAAMLG